MIAGIDPGIYKGVPAATVCIVDYPSIITHEHVTDFNEIVKLATCAEIVIVETPDPSFGIKPFATQALAQVSAVSGRLWGILQVIDGEVLSVPAETIREYTCGWNKHRRVKADPFIKNWLTNLHFPVERKDKRPELFKPRGTLSTDHKRDAYLAAYLAEMMLSSKMLASRVRAQSS